MSGSTPAPGSGQLPCCDTKIPLTSRTPPGRARVSAFLRLSRGDDFADAAFGVAVEERCEVVAHPGAADLTCDAISVFRRVEVEQQGRAASSAGLMNAAWSCDGRGVIVRYTDSGLAGLDIARQRMLELEADYAARIGAARWAEARTVLETLFGDERASS